MNKKMKLKWQKLYECQITKKNGNIFVILKTKQILNREANNAAYCRKPFFEKIIMNGMNVQIGKNDRLLYFPAIQ